MFYLVFLLKYAFQNIYITRAFNGEQPGSTRYCAQMILHHHILSLLIAITMGTHCTFVAIMLAWNDVRGFLIGKFSHLYSDFSGWLYLRDAVRLDLLLDVRHRVQLILALSLQPLGYPGGHKQGLSDYHITLWLPPLIIYIASFPRSQD